MASPERTDRLRPSLLDRLLMDPRGSRGMRGLSLRDLRRCVARDLEWLLNTRVVVDDLIGSLEEARRSVLSYGVPDFSHFSWDSQSDQNELSRRVQAAIEFFEPRLNPQTLGVSLLERTGIDDTALRLRIDAMLEVEPIREPVCYDAALDTVSASVSVVEAR